MLDIDFTFDETRLKRFCSELYYSCNLITEIKKAVAENPEDYTAFLEKEKAKEKTKKVN